MITLTSEERCKFADFLEQEAAANLVLAIQCDKLQIKVMADELRRQSAACSCVAHRLRITESDIHENLEKRKR